MTGEANFIDPISADSSTGTHIFQVANVIDDAAEPITIPPRATIEEALTCLDQTNLTHVPVVLGTKVLGIFSNRSVSDCFRHHPKGEDPRSAEIDDYLEHANFVRATQPLTAAVEQIEVQGVALVGTEDRLLAAIHSEQIRQYLWDIARPFSLIHDIEMSVRHIVETCCPGPLLLNQALNDCGMKHLLGKSVEQLTLGQAIRVGTSGVNQGIFRPGFGANNSLAKTKLESIRTIRNRVFHFSDDLADDDVRIETKFWLERRIKLLGHETSAS